MNKEWTTRRGRLLTLQKQDGRATYRLWCTECTLRFYLCVFYYSIKMQDAVKDFDLQVRYACLIA